MKRARSMKWSFVVIRGADQSVKQFRVSKKSVVAAPAAAVLAVTGCLAGLQIKAAYQARELKDVIAKQSDQLAETVAVKDQRIAALQRQLAGMSAEAEEVKEKVEELQGLENKLEQFIDKYGDRVNLSSGTGEDVAANGGSPHSARSITESYASAYAGSSSISEMESVATSPTETEADLESVGAIAEGMKRSMEETLQRAILVRAAVDAYPSEWPTRSRWLTSSFGYREDPFNGTVKFHAGIDIAGKSGDPVFSAADGIVVETGSGGSEGNYITVDHGGGLKSIYMHLLKIEAKEGDAVVRGEKIGLMGSSGRSTGTHLHFQIMENGEAVNPLPYLNSPSS